jgi:antitoxin SocA-like protein
MRVGGARLAEIQIRGTQRQILQSVHRHVDRSNLVGNGWSTGCGWSGRLNRSQEEPMRTAIDVADWIVCYRTSADSPVDAALLQKLLFFAQAFRLARYGEKLFEEPIDWRHGPVVPAVSKEFPESPFHHLVLGVNRPPPQFDDELDGYLRNVVGFFSRLQPFEIFEAADLDRLGFRHPSVDAIRVFYAGLLDDGENALSAQELLDRIPEPELGTYYKAGICARRVTNHPLYDLAFAEWLSRPVPRSPKTPHVSIKKRDLASAR